MEEKLAMEFEMGMITKDPWKEESESESESDEYEEVDDDSKNDGKRIRTAAGVYSDPAILWQKLVDYDLKNPDAFLGANRSIKKVLFCRGDRQINIREALNGKIIALFFYPVMDGAVLPPYVSHFYSSLKRKHEAEFEMLYVPIPPPPLNNEFYDGREPDFEPWFFQFLSHLPFPALHVHDSSWGEYLSRKSRPRRAFWSAGISFIDTTSYPEIRISSRCDETHVSEFGPYLYPFTPDRLLVVTEQFSQLAARKSITDILGGTHDSYLVNRYGARVPVSSLENKDVALCAYYQKDCFDRFLKQLEIIYNKKDIRDKFEVVFVNLQHNGGYEDQTSFNNAVSSMPWLALPFDDDRIWNLKFMMFDIKIGCRSRKHGYWTDFPIMFIKTAGDQSLIDPYGYLVLDEFGPESYPFTRAKAGSMTMDKLSTLTWESFANEAQKLGLDFNSLLLSTNDDVSLSTIFPNQDNKPMLLLFAMTGCLSLGKSDSLIDAYFKARQSSPFEVIFVSIDNTKMPDPFIGKREIMPWHAVKTPLSFAQHSNLLKATLGFDISKQTCHFIAFESDGTLLRVGITTLFDEPDFPFQSNEEYKKQVKILLKNYCGWRLS